MKPLLKKTCIAFTLFLVMGCGDKQKDANSNKKVENPSISEIVKKAKTNVSITDKLKTLEPINKELMDSWMPTKLSAMDRETYIADSNPQLGVFIAKAVYKNPNTSELVDITFMDGAGDKGSRAFSPYLNLERHYTEHSDNDGFQKIIKKNDMTVVQKYKKYNDSFVLEFAARNRYAIKIETKKLSESQLWELFNQFDFNALPGID
jgi:hypothetical protein